MTEKLMKNAKRLVSSLGASYEFLTVFITALLKHRLLVRGNKRQKQTELIFLVSQKGLLNMIKLSMTLVLVLFK